MITKRTSIIFVEKDSFSENPQIVTCQSYESADGEKTISSQSTVVFDLEGFSIAEAIVAGMQIAAAVKGIYSKTDPRTELRIK